MIKHITLTFLYRSRGKGRRRRFGAQNRYFSGHHRWVSLSFRCDVGLDCVPAQRLCTSVFIQGSLGYDRTLLSFRGRRFCWAWEKTRKWYGMTVSLISSWWYYVLLKCRTLTGYLPLSDLRALWNATQCIFPERRKKNISVPLNRELWKHNKLLMPTANALKTAVYSEFIIRSL